MDICDGLTSQQARDRLQRDGPNVLPVDHGRTFARQVWDVVRQPMLLLLLAASTLSFAIAELLDGLVLTTFVLLVIAITVRQERKTENVLRNLRHLTAPQAVVIRDGRTQRIPGDGVVRDDLLVLEEGARVPADAVVLSATVLSLDEATLTGESVPVTKVAVDHPTAMGAPGGDDSPWVFSGTIVTSGHGLAIVRETGTATELGRIGSALTTIPEERTPLQREVQRIVSIIAVVALAAAVFVTVGYHLSRGSWAQAGLAGIATAMAMLPEEFPVVLTVFMALGAWRMAKHGILARRSVVIETLGTASVVCVDKTGTLTANRMSLHEVVIGSTRHMVDSAESLETPVLALIESGVLASPPHSADPMDRAFVEMARTSGLVVPAPTWRLVREYPLSPELPVICQVWQARDSTRRLACAKGAPEAVARLCSRTDDGRDPVHAGLAELAADGQRVLAIARREFDEGDPLPSGVQDLRLDFVGLAGLRDPLRPGVTEAVAECERAGVRTIMITGDYPGTALAIAHQAGIMTNTGALTGAEVANLDDAGLESAVRRINVFARMRPTDKLRLVRALQVNDAIVAMTGDGVNDAPALRAAQIGIAFGERGTDVAREAAALVITDDAYTSIVTGIRHGRRIFANLRKALAYVVAVHVPIFGMSVIPLLIPGWPIVLLPTQVAFLELIIDPACSVAFEAEPGSVRLMNQPPRPPRQPLFSTRVLVLAIGQGLAALTAVIAVYSWSVRSGYSVDHVRSLTFATLVFANLALILVNRSWHRSAWSMARSTPNRPVLWIVIGACAVLFTLFSIPLLRDLFRLEALSFLDWLIAVIGGALGAAAFEIYKVTRHRRRVNGDVTTPT